MKTYKETQATAKNLKSDLRTLSGARKVLLSFNDDKEMNFVLTSFAAKYLRSSKKDANKYKELESITKSSTKGLYSDYTVIMSLRFLESISTLNETERSIKVSEKAAKVKASEQKALKAAAERETAKLAEQN